MGLTYQALLAPLVPCTGLNALLDGKKPPSEVDFQVEVNNVTWRLQVRWGQLTHWQQSWELCERGRTCCRSSRPALIQGGKNLHVFALFRAPPLCRRWPQCLQRSASWRGTWGRLLEGKSGRKTSLFLVAEAAGRCLLCSCSRRSAACVPCTP